jgi:hypothetical protein
MYTPTKSVSLPHMNRTSDRQFGKIGHRETDLMQRRVVGIIFTVFCLLPGIACTPNSAKTAPRPVSSADVTDSLPPLKDPATVDQIQEYLRLSGAMDAFRLRWIAAVDANRSIGAPYWPESFWTDIKAEMQKTDLLPMFVTVYQHAVSKELMQEVLDSYHARGLEHIQGSLARFRLTAAQLAMTDDSKRLELAKTLEVINKVYAVYKPQIKAARIQYMADHPHWVDKYR